MLEQYTSTLGNKIL